MCADIMLELCFFLDGESNFPAALTCSFKSQTCDYYGTEGAV